MTLPVSGDAIAAVLRAAAVVRERHRADPLSARYTEAALAEQVVALPDTPAPLPGGWWRVGHVLDAVAGRELGVRLHPGRRRLRLVAVPPPVLERPPAQPPGAGYFDGERLRWVGRGDDPAGRPPG